MASSTNIPHIYSVGANAVSPLDWNVYHQRDWEFYAYDTTTTEIGTTDTDIPLDTEIIDGDVFTFTPATGVLQIDSDGEYVIDIDVGLDCNIGDVIELKIQLDTGSGYSNAPGSLSYISG